MPVQPCIAEVGDFIVVRDLTEDPDWLGRVFCVERPGPHPLDPFGGCGGAGHSGSGVFYHYVALRHVGRISAADAECVKDECDLLLLEKQARANWGRWGVACGRRDLAISGSDAWRAWSQAPCLNWQFQPPGFTGESGGLIGGCGGDPQCCPPCL